MDAVLATALLYESNFTMTLGSNVRRAVLVGVGIEQAGVSHAVTSSTSLAPKHMVSTARLHPSPEDAHLRQRDEVVQVAERDRDRRERQHHAAVGMLRVAISAILQILRDAIRMPVRCRLPAFATLNLLPAG